MREEHLDLFPELHRDVVLAGLRNVSGDLAGIFMLFAGDLARLGVGAAFGFGWARLADVLQCAVTGCALAGRPPVRVRVIAAELLQFMALWADVLVVIGVPLEVGAAPGSIVTARLVYNRDMRGDLAIDQPAQQWPGAVSRVR